MKNEPISRIMTPSPATLTPADSVARAERLMREHRCHHVPVVDDGQVVGMLSSHDLLKALFLRPQSDAPSDASLDLRRIDEVMQRQVVVLPQTATLLDAAMALSGGSVHALPIVALNNAVVGIVTSSDLIAALVDDLKYPAGEPVPVSASPNEGTTVVQTRMLREVFRAAVYYLESGRAEIEHARLLKAVARAREALAGSDLHI
jgi:acetoin utilization protein AcuB